MTEGGAGMAGGGAGMTEGGAGMTEGGAGMAGGGMLWVIEARAISRRSPAYGERVAGAWPSVSRPQQAIVPSVLIPHENEVPALTAL